MMRAAIRNASEALAKISDTARLDVELLMAHALGCSRMELLLRQDDLAVPPIFSEYLARRMAHEPVAYIIGAQEFWGLDLAVSPAVLIPRSDSETLIEMALEHATAHAPPKRILDLGTGSGALLLAALSEFPNATGLGIDASESALLVATSNARDLGLADRTRFTQQSWRDADWTQAIGAGFDLILCNPPYIETSAVLAPMVAEHEPHSALFAGADGLDDYRILIPALSQLLSKGGYALFEMGWQQDISVAALAQEQGFVTEMRRDLAGHPRCIKMCCIQPMHNLLGFIRINR